MLVSSSVASILVPGHGPCWFGPQPLGWLNDLGPASSSHGYLMVWALSWPPVATLGPVLLAVHGYHRTEPWLVRSDVFLCLAPGSTYLREQSAFTAPWCNCTLASKVRYTLTETYLRWELLANKNALQANMNNTIVDHALGTCVVVRGSNCFYWRAGRFTFNFRGLTFSLHLAKISFYKSSGQRGRESWHHIAYLYSFQQQFVLFSWLWDAK